MTDWDALLGSINIKVIVLVVPIVLGCALTVGVFVALPIAVACELVTRNARAATLALVLSLLSVVAILFLGWRAIPSAAVYVILSVLVWRLRPILNSDSGAARRYSSAVGYVLLVGGGLLGVHNYYLSRAWAGILYFTFLLLGTAALGTFFTYVFYLLLGCLLIADAALMPSRIWRLQDRWESSPRARRQRLP
ncbi:hypothetical protein IT072_19340 [Leifsonia sp. ZF2019]|uniref:hypothetical protein n=1 Tax=Leifsonia sp. ZF2019 TaxID=2781978 RepID=UPI001CBFB455|nr:hypothetical protein [Leifsonia sp. ZF2019]UAJ79319.1 hypothetical protein IT072_19340 [Leifsonia sp. ZF2019]